MCCWKIDNWNMIYIVQKYYKSWFSHMSIQYNILVQYYVYYAFSFRVLYIISIHNWVSHDYVSDSNITKKGVSRMDSRRKWEKTRLKKIYKKSFLRRFCWDNGSSKWVICHLIWKVLWILLIISKINWIWITLMLWCNLLVKR